VLVARDAVIQAGAFISDSAILPSAVVGDGAVIARSVIPPGTHVPSGARVVDQVFATLLAANDEVS
jgi:ADP-glucose pyrophosphorylase